MTQHESNELWLAYIQDQLPEVVRNRMEKHLESCDDCLQAYMANLNFLPLAEPGEELFGAAFTDQVMASLPTLQTVGKKLPSKERWFHRTIVHYAAAAAVTIIMMSSGVFSEVPKQLERLEASQPWKQGDSLSDQLMKKTSTFLDSIQPKETGGK
ncbi:MAG: hypothetical protein H7X86_06235 [Gorillibacterium sp.]|nr:hypothetical protein [Gorillibacterium sp.]